MLNKTYFLIALILITLNVVSQESNGLEPVENTGLNTTEKVVFDLRQNYGVKASVELTKTLWQILNSYSNQEQAKTLWQSAVNDVTSKNETISFSIDPHYNSGEVLINNFNGMTTQKWNDNRQLISVNKDNINDFFASNDDLTVYFNLQKIWNVLLDSLKKQKTINWPSVFNQSLSVYQLNSDDDIESNQDSPKTHSSKNETLKTNSITHEPFISNFEQWYQSENKEFDLAKLMHLIDSSKEIQLYQSLVSFVLAKQSNKLMPIVMNWFNVAQKLRHKTQEFSEKELNYYFKFVEENDVWFLTKEQDLLNVNVQLPIIIESSFHQLKKLIKSSDSNEVASLTTIYNLLNSNFNKYMSSPFRNKSIKDLEVCLNISEEYLPLPQEPIDENQFNGCIKDIYHAAVVEAKSRELAGTLIKVENQQALDRALKLPVWQTVNIIYADMSSRECLKTAQQLPNPFEWTIAAESMLWFADRWPAYMNKFQQKNKIQEIINEGMLIINGLKCVEGKQKELLDAQFNLITRSWNQVETDIQKVVDEFNASNLKQGSDLDLINASNNKTNYRVEGAKIAACNVQNSCGVLIELEPSRALYSLFPHHLLMADQLKQGDLKLCYDDVGWEERRAAPTHLDNKSMANYMGKFSFSLKGFYNGEEVFSRKVTDKQEYNYIFAANTEEVLNTYCPLSIVGNKISTILERGTFGLVPNRLTFLTASRANETDILLNNWEKGAEWDSAVLGSDIESEFVNSLDEQKVDVLTVYQQKAKALQDIIYKSILNIQINQTKAQKALADSFATMKRHKKLLLSYNYLLQMDKLMQDDNLHGLFFGKNRIVDASLISAHFEDQLNIDLLKTEVKENLKSNQEKWNALSKTLSNSHIKSIIYRLKTIYL